MSENVLLQSTVRKKDGGCTFTGHIEGYSLTAVVPTLTALLMSSLDDLEFFFVF